MADGAGQCAMDARDEAGSVRCRKCTRETILGRHIVGGRCPVCRQHRWWMLAVALAGACLLGGGVVWWAIAAKNAGIVEVLLVYLCSFPLVVLHELTHAFAAFLAGWDVQYLGIGSGLIRKRFHVGRILVVLHRRAWGSRGFCGMSPPVGRYSRGAAAFIIGLPLALHLLAVVAALLSPLPVVVVRPFVLINLLIVVINAWPRRLRAQLYDATDGLLLRELWRHPEIARERWCRARWLNPVAALHFEGQNERAFALAERAVAENPGDAVLRFNLASVAIQSRRWDVALSLAPVVAGCQEKDLSASLSALPDDELAALGALRGEELVDSIRAGMLGAAERLDEVIDLYERRADAARSEEARALWRSHVAMALVMADQNVDRAKAAAHYAYVRLPWVALVESVWGMMLIEVGDPREGLNLFERAARNDLSQGSAALRAAWTVVAQCALGSGGGAIPDIVQAPNVWPACRRRAERALGR